MNATPPEANIEYSRGDPPSGGVSGARRGTREGRESALGGRLAGGLLAGGLLGALLLVVAEFTALFQVRAAATAVPVRSASTGSHHSYAMALIAVCAVALSIAVWRLGSRPALLGIGVLGIAALLIALLGDLPDASATGLVFTSSHYVIARARPSAGFYLETLGALVLLLTSVWGLLLVGLPGGREASSASE